MRQRHVAVARQGPGDKCTHLIFNTFDVLCTQTTTVTAFFVNLDIAPFIVIKCDIKRLFQTYFIGRFPAGTRRRVQLHLPRSQVHIYLTTETVLLPFDNRYPVNGTGSALNIHIPGSHRLGRETLTRDIHSIGIFSHGAHRFRSHTPDFGKCSSHRYVP